MASAVLRTLGAWYKRMKNPRPTNVAKVNSMITGQKRAVQPSPDRENKRRCLEKTMELNSTETRKDEEMRQCGVILEKTMELNSTEMRQCGVILEKTMELNSTETQKDEEMRRCGVILEKLMKDKYGWYFNMPVDVVALGIRDYHKNVKRPLDFGIVKLKLDMGGYENSLDFAKDVRLTFYNAMFCSEIGDDAQIMATSLLDMFEKQFDPTYEKFEVERRALIVEQQKFSKPLAEFTQSQAVDQIIKDSARDKGNE
ncbi:hypothetical protein POM88_005869 [Heracleum sosnowskyi]|uniref:Bromo domain-containing protein n=1 Tax=Heracleum sosnowskyi TaxID=360622 RepID=A0AAD8J2C0_9APIA|nr:hypothetical protein POM88_005869 [Heracleum sosnowskyi]